MKDKQAKYPQLRFKGFTDPWEKRKLSSISERVTRKNKNNESTLPLTISAQDGLVDQNDFFNKQVASRDVTGYFLVKNGEFAYNKSYSNGYPWGAIKRLDKYDMGVLSTLYIVFRPTKINSQFLVSYYDTTRWYREVSKNAAEGARNHGLLNIAPTDFFNTLLVVPKIVDEQQKIGSFFKQLDDIIALHQRKLDLLKEQKKGYLQKMFPKNGAKVPELRFAGFADDWEKRKLGDLLKEFSIKSKIEDEHKVLSSTNSGMEFREGRVSGTSNLGYKIIKNGDLILSPQNLWLGNININNIGKGLVSPSYKTFELINIDSSFINPQLRTQKMLEEYKNSSTQGASVVRRNLEIDSFYQIKIFVPTISEQEKIGSFFQQLDDTIALHQRKLEKLQELKKGYLQKMFC
ncbi:restriction endonuclease subunit S [Loigolactobacillus backii]|uniref:restriction endonuclease subunit S n=1 Tax=Loigolactobacillus backii TaxID=375175 RepID=UPI0007F11BDD|nr:restriction endonuclease subunit S [Loigolactobacillus backii]ANK61119.1 restriction endonuclease subunit S [Loigolactobacillus backii]